MLFGNWSSRPKVMSPEVTSPETRVKSPAMLSHVARILSGEVHGETNKGCVYYIAPSLNDHETKQAGMNM